MDKYVLHKNPLAYGGNSKVYKCRDLLGQRSICKMISKTGSSDRKFRNEVDVMKQLIHLPKTVNIYNSFEDDDNYYIIMEYCRGGAILDYIQGHKTFSENTASSLIRGICRGLHTMHENGYVHRDIKPGNILLTDKSADAEIKIADYGATLKINGTKDDPCETKRFVGTPLYMPPEALRSLVGTKSDIWSLGAMTYQLLTGKYAYDGKNAQAIWKKLSDIDPDWSEDIWYGISSDAKKFVRNCLAKDYSSRPSALDCIKDNWLLNSSCEDRFNNDMMELINRIDASTDQQMETLSFTHFTN